MTSFRPFEPNDLFRFNTINFDPLTETFGVSFYLQYIINWPEYFQVAIHPSGKMMGYIMGKAEGRGTDWHGHVTAVSVDPEFRRMKLAAAFMENLEKISDKKGCYFVDLFVRVSNEAARKLYRSLGYIVYRRIIDYYAGNSAIGEQDEDSYDMRKALSRDVDRRSVIPYKCAIKSSELENTDDAY